MNWQTLNTREKNSTIIAVAILVVIILYTFVFSPIWQNNQQLQLDLDAEKNLSAYLYETQQKLTALPNHPTLSQQQAQQHIKFAFRSQGTHLNGIVMQPTKSIISINKIPFQNLLNALQQLRRKHGILTTKATLIRLTPGTVSAHLTLSY